MKQGGGIFLYILATLFFFSLVSCVTCEKDAIKLGMQKEYIGYIPARISVFTCIRAQVNADQKNILSSHIDSLCKKMDQGIISAFKDDHK